MPQKTYTGISFTDYWGQLLIEQPNIVVTPFSQFNVVISASVNEHFEGANGSAQIGPTFSYRMSGKLNFLNIPLGSTISEVEVRNDYSLSATANSSSSPPSGIGSNGITASLVSEVEFNNIPNIGFSVSDSGLNSASVNASDAYSNVQVYDFSDTPITRDELIEQFNNWNVTMEMDTGSSEPVAFPSGGTADVSVVLGFAFSGIRVTVTYQDGPTQYTIEPSGGNGQPGQVIVVTGPGVGTGPPPHFFFETDDGIIPVEPQIISDDEVWIELPYPATDDCYNCMPECPECDAAFIPCDEDFASEACQEAIEECLDCLTDCLEELSRSKECQASTQEPDEEEPTVTLYIGTQFSGNVALGQFIILNADGSGLYRFTIGHTHDTLYNGSRDGTTYNVKIPNPGGKTAPFRS